MCPYFHEAQASENTAQECKFNELQAVGLFLAFDGTSTRTDPFTSEKKYRMLVNNAVFIRNKSLFFVSAVATSAFQLHVEHTSQLLCSECPEGYQIGHITEHSHRRMIVV